jgi:hypothetical protein
VDIPIALSDLATELVGRACAVFRYQSQKELRQLPEVQAILTADDRVRRECVLTLAWAYITLEWGHPWRQGQVHLVALVARKPAPLTLADLTWVVELAEAASDADVQPSETMAALTPQFRALYAREPAAGPLIARAAALTHYKEDGRRLEAIIATAIDERDDVGPRIRAVLDADPRGAELLTQPRASGFEHLAAPLVQALLAARDVDLVIRNSRVVFVTPGNETLACAIVALAGPVVDPADLRRLALKAITGPHGWERSLKLANACVRAMTSVRELTALDRATTHGSLKREIAAALDRLAAAEGVDRETLLESAVETHGLDQDGCRIELRDLKVRAPADLRAEAKAIRATLAAERTRIDGLFAREWPRQDWQRLYLDHPITGHLARRLLWHFGDTVALGADAPRSGRARLWHPLDATREALLAWRTRLLEGLVVQPLRQAWRETYTITPAEERAGTYSDRFAGIVFHQTQARALMKRRGWKPAPAAWWDDGREHGVASCRRAGLRIEFVFDPIVDDDVDPSGMYRSCTSRQVRFFGSGDEPLLLTDVPPVLFSEALRDVDLFVSVSSSGEGPLTAAGELRRAILTELLPRLPIHAHIEDRDVVVRGRTRSYRIDLGTGQIRTGGKLFKRTGTAGRRAARLYLPIDDDPVLTEILAAALTLD